MPLRAHIAKASLPIGLALALVACGKQGAEPIAATPAESAASFPAGNSNTAMTLADCDKLPDPKPADDSPAGRAAAVGQGQGARAACKKNVTAQESKSSSDLARIREIKENEQADRVGAKESDEEWRRGLKEGAAKPLKEYKY